ncbi:MAG: metal ABC transporter permease [Spirochaetaceae bacterium]|jgi:zinc transport system permease protein|nr:metal ABC transporter permease [Spirochaetaceae bacterium]
MLPFLRNALIAGLLSSVLFGVLGSVITVRKIASLSGSIAHAVLGGIGMALFFSATGILPNFPPIIGAFIFAVIAALVIAAVSLKAKEREDTVINAIWAIGMSIGVLFMAKTPGYTDPSSYLFGNILLISNSDLIMIAALDVLTVFLAWRFYPQIKASSFDEEFAQVRGVPVKAVYIAILVLIALAIVLLQTYVGIIMVIAMLTLPAGTAGCFKTGSLGKMMCVASIFSCIFSLAGLGLSWVWDLPTGAVTVVFAGIVFLLASGIRVIRRRN